MLYIRSFFYQVLMTFTVVIFGLLISFSSYFVSSPNLSKLANLWGKLNLYLLRIICNLQFNVTGIDFLPHDQPYIVLAKHQSTWETIALRCLLPFNQAWILKQELTKYPVFGRALIKTGQIAIDRSQGKKALRDLIEQGTRAYSQGKIIVVFPEGTRTTYGEVGKYHIGGAMLAEKCQALVIPIAHNAGAYWPKGFIVRPGTISLCIGPPIRAQEKAARQINEEVFDWIETRMKSLSL